MTLSFIILTPGNRIRSDKHTISQVTGLTQLAFEFPTYRTGSLRFTDWATESDCEGGGRFNQQNWNYICNIKVSTAAWGVTNKSLHAKWVGGVYRPRTIWGHVGRAAYYLWQCAVSVQTQLRNYATIRYASQSHYSNIDQTNLAITRTWQGPRLTSIKSIG